MIQQKVRKKKKTCLNAHFQYSQSKMWSLKSLAMLKCERRASTYAVQYMSQPGSVLMFCSYYFKNGSPRHFVLMFCGTASLAFFLACS